MLKRAALLMVSVLAACSSQKDDTVAVTLAFDQTVSNATLEDVRGFVLHASGDDSGAFAITLDRAVARTERTIYMPAPTSHTVALTADATLPDGTVVARSAAATVDVGPSIAAKVTLVLSSTTAPAADLSLPTDGGSPFPGTDLGTQDFATKSVPQYVGYSTGSNDNGNALTIAAPSGVMSNDIVIAMATNAQFTTEPVAAHAPQTFNQITSVTGPDGGSITVFYWHTVVAGETSYAFSFDGKDSASVTLVAYRGVTMTTPLSASLAQENGGGTTATFPSVTPMSPEALLIGLAVAPNKLNLTYTAPAGFASHDVTGALIADIPVSGTAATSTYTFTSAAASRIMFLVAALAPM